MSDQNPTSPGWTTQFTNPMTGASSSAPFADPGHNTTDPAKVRASLASRVSPIIRNEGSRGQAARAAVVMRHVAYLCVILICTAIAHASFIAVPGAGSGGRWVLFGATFQLAVAAVGTMLFPNRRAAIIEEARTYVFGWTVLPATALALFMWGARSLAAAPAGETDMFLSTLTSALPWIYFLPIVIPCIVFLRMIAGLRTIHKVQEDDQELMAMMTRHDGLQR